MALNEHKKGWAPRLDGLKRFLETVASWGPTSVYRIAMEGGFPYITAYRYMRYCLEKGLVRSLREGRKGSLRLVLTEKGRRFLEALDSA